MVQVFLALIQLIRDCRGLAMQLAALAAVVVLCYREPKYIEHAITGLLPVLTLALASGKASALYNLMTGAGNGTPPASGSNPPRSLSPNPFPKVDPRQ